MATGLRRLTRGAVLPAVVPDGGFSVRQPGAARRPPAETRPDAAGPHTPARQLAAYLEAEQELGRVSADIAPEAAATLLIGACFHRAFVALFFASDAPSGVLDPPDDDVFAARVVHTLLTGAAR